jgi:hypothetical protein
MGNPEEPRPEREVAIVGAQPEVRAHEHILQRFLGVLTVGKHLAGIRQQSSVIAVIDDPKSLVVAAPEQRNELLVRAQAQQR